jgi:hypothetical protein
LKKIPEQPQLDIKGKYDLNESIVSKLLEFEEQAIVSI